MQTQATIAGDAAQLGLIKRKMQLEKQARGGANWFFWIAGLSVLNSALYLLGIRYSLLFGLGMTQFVDGYITGMIRVSGPTWSFLHVIGFGIDLCIAGAFVLIGYFGRKRVRWVIRVGMVLYALDGILMLVFKAYLGAAFHALALFSIWIGLLAIKQLDVLEKPLPGESTDDLVKRSIASLRSPRASITPQQKRLRWILVALILVVPTTMLCIAFSLQH